MQQYLSSLHTQESFFFFYRNFKSFSSVHKLWYFVCMSLKGTFLTSKEFARYMPGNNLTSFVCCKEILQTFCLKKNKDITRQIHFLSRLISFRDKHTLNPFLPERKNIFRKKSVFLGNTNTPEW